MAMRVARPWLDKTSNIWYLRRRVPKDLVGFVGQSIVKQSLGKDPAEAKRRYHRASAELEARWAELRNKLATIRTRSISGLTDRDSGEVARRPLFEDDYGDDWEIVAEHELGSDILSERQAHELARPAYDWLLAEYRENPSFQFSWYPSLYRRLWADEASYMDRERERAEGRIGFDTIVLRAMRLLSIRYMKMVLRHNNLKVDILTRYIVMRAVAAALQRASLKLKEESEGYHQEYICEAALDSNKIPPSVASVAKDLPITFDDAIQTWKLAKAPRPRTVSEWTSVMRQLQLHLGQDDVRQLTAKNLIDWRDSMRRSGLSAKTIRDAKFAAVKAILRVLVDDERLQSNPAEKVKIPRKVGETERKRGYTDQEAAVVLRAAHEAEDAVRRWIPFLCAYTGARLNELCHLRVEDVEATPIAFLKIDPSAGLLKTPGSERVIPLHPELIRLGFLDFVRGRGAGPLFPELPPDAFGKRGGNATKILGRWVRHLGLVDDRLDPNHGWRHRFRTVGRERGVQVDVLDALLAHTRRSVGDNYGHFSVMALSAGINSMPKIDF